MDLGEWFPNMLPNNCEVTKECHKCLMRYYIVCKNFNQSVMPMSKWENSPTFLQVAEVKKQAI
jgi:hypothetical protein